MDPSLHGAPRTLIALGLVAVLLPHAHAQWTSEEDTEYFKVQLMGISTFYGSEKWKTSPAFHSGNPAAVQNDASMFDGAIGHRVILRIRLIDEATGNVSTDPPTEMQRVNITASIQTPKGPLAAFVQRAPGLVPGASDSSTFFLNFDMDGTNLNVPGTTTPAAPLAKPVVPPGPVVVKVDITKSSTTPGTSRPVGTDNIVFDYQRPAQTVQVASLGERDYTADVPDTMFRLYSDIGYGNSVPLIMDQLRNDAQVRADYAFGVPGASVQLYALSAVRCAPPSTSCAPGPASGPAAVDVLRKEMGPVQKTDTLGNVSFTFPASELLTFQGRTLTSGLIVLAAVLLPELDHTGDLPQSLSKGGFNLRTGAREIVIPVASRPARVIGYDINTQVQDNQSAAAPTQLMTVNLYDDAGAAPGCGNCGSVVAIVPDDPAKGVLSSVQMSSYPDAVDAAKYRRAQLQTNAIQAARITSYRVVGLFYQSPTDDFQGLVYADRGYRLTTYAAPTRITDQGTLYLNFTSVTTNYDLRTTEPSFALRVQMKVQPEGQRGTNQTITVPEGGIVSYPVPISSSRVGELPIVLQGKTGDTDSGAMTISASFHNNAPKKSLGDRIPGVELPAIVAALALAFVLWRRREAF